MLAPIKHLLAEKYIVLASGSPRRQELIKAIGLNAVLCPSNFEEILNPDKYSNFSDFVTEIALGKANEVYDRLTNNDEHLVSKLLVIAADTIVTLNDKCYGKPKDSEDAIRMLTNLSGVCNRVYTGVVLKHSKGFKHFVETADVYFGELSTEQIEAYVATGDPLDKAGAYGIQGIGGALIRKVNGDFYCVMGLPLNRLSLEITKLLQEI